MKEKSRRAIKRVKYDREYHLRNREKRLQKMSEYNRRYYLENRERLKLKRLGITE